MSVLGTSDVTAISGTRRQVKELADGTLSLTVHIDPPYRAAFHRMFPEIDMPIAITPLLPEAVATPKPAEKRASTSQFPPGLTGLSVRWCLDEDFQDWVAGRFPAAWAAAVGAVGTSGEKRAAYIIKNECGVLSRNELDVNAAAETVFNERFRLPYSDHRKENSLD